MSWMAGGAAVLEPALLKDACIVGSHLAHCATVPAPTILLLDRSVCCSTLLGEWMDCEVQGFEVQLSRWADRDKKLKEDEGCRAWSNTKKNSIKNQRRRHCIAIQMAPSLCDMASSVGGAWKVEARAGFTHTPSPTPLHIPLHQAHPDPCFLHTSSTATTLLSSDH